MAYGLSLRDREDPLRQATRRFGRAIPAAGGVAYGIARGRPVAPPDQYATLERPIVRGVERLLAPKISPQRYAKGYKRLTKHFGAQAGRYAEGGAKRGFFSKGGVATGMAGRPSAAFATGAAEYEVGMEREKARQLEAGIGLAGQYREDIGRYAQGYGKFAGEFARPQYDPYGRSNVRRASRRPSWSPAQYA